MSKKSKAKHPSPDPIVTQGELRRDAEERTLLEGRWKILGDGTPPTTRRKGYTYVDELIHLQFELLKMQEWVRLQGLKVCVLFEGRDAAGKGGVIKGSKGNSSRLSCMRSSWAAFSSGVVICFAISKLLH